MILVQTACSRTKVINFIETITGSTMRLAENQHAVLSAACWPCLHWRTARDPHNLVTDCRLNSKNASQSHRQSQSELARLSGSACVFFRSFLSTFASSPRPNLVVTVVRTLPNFPAKQMRNNPRLENNCTRFRLSSLNFATILRAMQYGRPQCWKFSKKEHPGF